MSAWGGRPGAASAWPAGAQRPSGKMAASHETIERQIVAASPGFYEQYMRAPSPDLLVTDYASSPILGAPPSSNRRSKGLRSPAGHMLQTPSRPNVRLATLGNVSSHGRKCSDMKESRKATSPAPTPKSRGTRNILTNPSQSQSNERLLSPVFTRVLQASEISPAKNFRCSALGSPLHVADFSDLALNQQGFREEEIDLFRALPQGATRGGSRGSNRPAAMMEKSSLDEIRSLRQTAELSKRFENWTQGNMAPDENLHVAPTESLATRVDLPPKIPPSASNSSPGTPQRFVNRLSRKPSTVMMQHSAARGSRKNSSIDEAGVVEAALDALLEEASNAERTRAEITGVEEISSKEEATISSVRLDDDLKVVAMESEEKVTNYSGSGFRAVKEILRNIESPTKLLESPSPESKWAIVEDELMLDQRKERLVDSLRRCGFLSFTATADEVLLPFPQPQTPRGPKARRMRMKPTPTDSSDLLSANNSTEFDHGHNREGENDGKKPKAKGLRGRINANREPLAPCISILESAFPDHLPPSIYFEYPTGLVQARHPESHPRIWKNLNPSVVPAMYFSHTSKVHVYNCVLNTLKKGGFLYFDKKEAKEANSIGKKDVKGIRCSLVWTSHLKPEQLKLFHHTQKTNHFPSSWYLGRKDLMWRSIIRMRRQFGVEYDITPPTFILPEDGRKFINTVRDETSAAVAASKPLWIAKPVAASCGRGVRIVGGHTKKLEKLAKRQLVVQKYVDPPLLIRDYKFDLRIYVAVTSFNPLRVLVDGLGKCSEFK